MIKALRHDQHLLDAAGSTCGNSALRNILARRALTTKTHLTADRIVITNGATEAINLALRAVTRPGDAVAAGIALAAAAGAGGVLAYRKRKTAGASKDAAAEEPAEEPEE